MRRPDACVIVSCVSASKRLCASSGTAVRSNTASGAKQAVTMRRVFMGTPLPVQRATRVPGASLLAVVNGTVTVILEAVDAAFRVFLHERTLRWIAVVVRLLFALAMARAVVRRILRIVDAVLALRGLTVPGISRARQFGGLRAQQETVRAHFLEGV